MCVCVSEGGISDGGGWGGGGGDLTAHVGNYYPLKLTVAILRANMRERCTSSSACH